jgi:ABC-2 type transport system permease protein
MPILAVAFILPAPYRFMPPTSFPVFLLFLFSMLLSLIVVVAYCMLIYIITFYTISSVGVKIIFVMIGDFFAGGIIPLPFLPDRFQGILSVLPFASMQNMPYRIYNGHIQGRALLAGIGLQILWAIVLIVIGYYGMQRATQRVIVQGG